MTEATETSSAARLSNTERDQLVGQFRTDGYCVLPRTLSEDLTFRALAAIDRITAEIRGSNTTKSVKVPNCVDTDAAFRELMMYEPALQLAFDLLGPIFHLCQSNFVSRPRDRTSSSDFINSSPWHADGPRPQFPAVDGRYGLYYLKFGYFLTSLTHGNGGPLQVVRGSHNRPELDGKGSLFNINDYADDLITFNCPAGTIVAFHQAQWHAAPPNQSDIERKNVYISYCGTWMKPLDRELPQSVEQLASLTAEERWLLGEPRPATRFWLPTAEDHARLFRFRRDCASAPIQGRNYE